MPKAVAVAQGALYADGAVNIDYVVVVNTVLKFGASYAINFANTVAQNTTDWRAKVVVDCDDYGVVLAAADVFLIGGFV